MDEAKLRAWWSHRQAMDGGLAGQSAAEVLERTGWARSVGGSGPYLGLFVRCGAGREAVDAAIARLEIHELPSARACTYVLPASDFALALRVAQAGGEGEMNTARKLGVTDREIDRLCEAVARALEKGPLEPDALKEAIGGAVRNLGEEGKKKGLTTTLPVALERLQLEGEIRRISTNGRLDQQRYRYALWRPNPVKSSPAGSEAVHTVLARRYFAWTGPATLADWQWFSGLGVKAAKTAVEPLVLEPVEKGSERLMFAEDRAAFESFRTPKDPQYALVSSIDGIALLRRDLKSLLAEGDLKRAVMTGKGSCSLGGLTDLPSHAILDRGRVVGLWEYDTAAESIAWMAFVKPDKALKEAVARMESFVSTDLGDARSFSLDSPKSREPRIKALRKASGA